jgi:signal transduction histidine kinase
MTTSKTTPHFSVSPRVLGPLGAEQLQDPALAVLELIKNAWDADATRVTIRVDQRVKSGGITVLDDGHGMSTTDFSERWLVIGASRKRGREKSEGGRPLIGEKGLGRLASFALGGSITIKSARRNEPGFSAFVNWDELSVARSLEEYEVRIKPMRRRVKGTRIEIENLKAMWRNSHTEFLITHAEFLASVPGQRFSISLKVDGKNHVLEDPLETIDRLAEARLEMSVGARGVPRIASCMVNGVDESAVLVREMSRQKLEPGATGIRLSLRFFRRGEASKRLDRSLDRNEIRDVLERYQGVRIYRDGINVPPYGLNGDDWAGLEKLRTSTGGPTLTPGNSQLVGELHVSRRAQPQLVITAGRTGFSDQTAVRSLRNYVQWAVRALATARRAQHLGIVDEGRPIPARVDGLNRAETEPPDREARSALARLVQSEAVRKNPLLKQSVEETSHAVEHALDRSEATLRLYAQLASAGIAATSFAHELRTEFDVVSEAIDQLKTRRHKAESELIELLNSSWSRIRAFGALFKVIPVKLRRQSTVLSVAQVKSSLKAILELAPSEKVLTEVKVPQLELSIVPAEFDSILLNLVSNAVKAIAQSARRESGRIRVSLAVQGAELTIRVADNGCGVSPKVASVMFEPLEGQFSEGTGMGLPIVKFIAERYKGTVRPSVPAPAGYTTEMLVTLRGVVR